MYTEACGAAALHHLRDHHGAALCPLIAVLTIAAALGGDVVVPPWLAPSGGAPASLQQVQPCFGGVGLLSTSCVEQRP